MVLGDLSEAFKAQAARLGTARAHAWYWLEAARLTWGFWRWTPRPRWQRGTVMAMDDLRYAVRRLRKQTLATLVSVATLACAIGAAASAWSLVSTVLLRPLPVDEPDRLVAIDLAYDTSRGTRTSRAHLYPLHGAVRDAGLMDVAAWGSATASTPLLVESDGQLRDVRAAFVSHAFFPLLGVRVSLGRSFTPEEDRRGAPPAMVLSDRFWRRAFAADPDVIGRVIRIRDREARIVGVVPRDFRGLAFSLALNDDFQSDRLLSGAVYLDAQGYDAPRAGVFFDTLRETLEGHPAIGSMAYSYSPGSMGGGYPVQVDGEPRELPSELAFVGIDDRYLRTIGLPVVTGRDFTPDDRAGAPLVAMVSRSLARFLAPDGDPIGRRIREMFRRPGKPADTIEIVGVVPDVVTRIGTLEPLVLYRPIAQQPPSPRRTVTFRASGDAGVAAAAMVRALRGIDPAVRPSPMTTLDAQLLDQMGPQRFGMAVMGALGAIALLLSVLGVWVLAETMATRRRREMGIRAALGASGRHLRGLLLSDTLRLVGLGLVLGLGLSWLGAGTIRAFLFQVEPLDPTVTASVAGLILVLTVVVSLRPAFTAARVDLARVLRED